MRVWCVMYFDEDHECEPEAVKVFPTGAQAQEYLEECQSIPEVKSGEISKDSYWLQSVPYIE